MKAKLHFIAVLVLLLLFTTARAQQDPYYSQYMFNGLVLNPAYAGSREVLTATAIYRDQWAGLAGAPKTQTLSLHSPLKNEKIGLGITAFHDQVGIFNQFGVYGSYAYQFRFGKNRLATGLSGGFSTYQADWSKIQTTDPNDAAFNLNEQAVFIPNFGTGIYLFRPDKYYVGISVPRLLQSKIDFQRSKSQTSKVKAQSRYYFVTAGYLYNVNEFLKLEPSMLLKYSVELPAQLDVNLQLIFGDFLKAGTSFRTGGAFVFMVEYQMSNQFSLGYAYDLINSNLGNYANGSHELMIRFEFLFEKGKIMNPRYF